VDFPERQQEAIVLNVGGNPDPGEKKKKKEIRVFT
jgi:hypothetical protein